MAFFFICESANEGHSKIKLFENKKNFALFVTKMKPQSKATFRILYYLFFSYFGFMQEGPL